MASPCGEQMLLNSGRLGLVLVMLAACLAPAPVLAQRDLVDVKVTTSKRTSNVRTGPKKATAVAKATNGMLVVMTDPPGASIYVNGQLAGTSDEDGEFSKEFPAGKPLNVKVTAGAEYATLTRPVTLKARQVEILRAGLDAKVGLVKIGPIIDGAVAAIDDQPPPKVKLDKEENVVLLDAIPPGPHRITYAHPDYLTVSKDIAVEAGQVYSMIFNPKLATTELVVLASEPDTDVYVDGVSKGKTPGRGELKAEIKLGDHEVKLVKDGFEEFKCTAKFEYGKPVRVDAKLVPLPTSAEWNDDFDLNLNKWAVAATGGVSAKAGKLMVAKAPGLAVPKGVTQRNFVMAFYLRLDNGNGAAWAVRVKDTNNYYLFYLSGPGGLTPGRFNTYIVKDGQFVPTNPVSSVPVITALSARAEYHVEVEGKGNVITHTLTPASTGRPEPLGVFQDPNSTFMYGGVGFRTVAGEAFSVDDLYVQPPR